MSHDAIACCRLCGDDLPGPLGPDDGIYRYTCRRCGRVALHETVDTAAIPGKLHLLSGWTRERTEKGERALTILANDVDPAADGITLDAVLNLPVLPRSITDRIQKLLEALARRSPYFGAEIGFSSLLDYPLAYLEHVPEDLEHRHPFHKLTEQIIQRGWIGKTAAHQYYLTAEGLEYLEKRHRQSPESRDCFVAMKFGVEFLDRAYQEGIAPAVRDAGYLPVQMAYLEHNNNILDEMLAAIRRSRLLIADLTTQNQNVYYEAGFALGLGVPVIFTCHDADAPNIRFDTQQFSQIRWLAPRDLRVKLKNRILATIG
jgi:hypothetical protein